MNVVVGSLLVVLIGNAAASASWLSELEVAYGPLRATPCGHRPVVCVREVADGALLRFPTASEAALGSDLAVVHANGTVDLVLVPPQCHAFMNAWNQFAGTHMASPLAGSGVPDGWIKSAGVYQMDPANEIHKFAGQWTVPEAPKTPHRPETLYYFIGLEDRTQGKLTTIHQPVLTWGDETEGGQYPNQWHLWSWTCCPKNLTWHSKDIAGFNAGDTIYGTIEKTLDATWRIDGAFKDNAGNFQNTTLTSQVGNFNYNYADVTLEVYNVSNCDQMARGSAAFSQLDLATSDGRPWVPPTWYISGYPTTCVLDMKIADSHTMTIASGTEVII